VFAFPSKGGYNTGTFKPTNSRSFQDFGSLKIEQEPSLTPTVDEFVRSLVESELLTAEQVNGFLGTFPPEKQPRTASDLAREMFRQRLLTKFQAQAVYQGKVKYLVLGNYVMLDRLGGGGMGQVYKAEHRRMERIVALKILPPATVRSKESLLRFQREMKAVAKLSHPNIVTAYDADEAKGFHFLVMECVDGGNLAIWVKQHGPMPVGLAVACILQAARGLGYAHGEGVIHRDVKPSNLLLDKRGVVKILDLGLARLEQAAGAADELTQSGYVMGSIDYMSPEQGFDMRSADHRSDVYGLGCTLWYLLTGRPIYVGESMVQKVLAHRDRPIPSLQAARSDVPEVLDRVFRRMIAKKAQDRQQSMAQVVAELQGCGLPTGQRTDGFSGALAPTEELADRQPASPSGPAALAPIPSLIDEWLVEEPQVPSERWLAPTWRTIQRRAKRRQLWILWGVLASVLSVLLAWLIVAAIPRSGNPGGIPASASSEAVLVVTVNQPDAMIQVVDRSGKVVASRTSGLATVSLTVDPGQYRLRVDKDGFRVSDQEFTVQRGQTLELQATLTPLDQAGDGKGR
jgi:serine/threonine protein kinase